MIKLSEDEQSGYDILSPHMPEDLAIDIIKHRRAKKAKLTARVAKMLLEEYKSFGNVEKAAEHHLARGWVFFKCEWINQASRFTDQHHPTPRPSVNYGHAEIVPPPKPLTPEQQAKRREIVALARQAVRGAMQ